MKENKKILKFNNQTIQMFEVTDYSYKISKTMLNRLINAVYEAGRRSTHSTTFITQKSANLFVVENEVKHDI